MNRIKIERPYCLIVDDLPENLIALKGILENEDMNILTATSGDEALELLLKHEFALAILDVQMPNMSGFELAEFMRKTSWTKNIPIIFVTAAQTETQRVFQGYEVGAVDFLQKPLESFIVKSKARIFLDLYVHKKKLERAVKSRDDFLAICSHELKTPLTSMKLQLQIMNRRRTNQEVKTDALDKYFQQTEKGLDRITRLIDDMLDIARLAEGKLTFQIVSTNLSALVREVVERMRPILDNSQCPITLEMEEDLIVKLDRFRIEQVIINLLSNVSKYASGAPVKISLSKNKRTACLSVKDEGPGISTENQGLLFQRFERIENRMSQNGLGLGLFISREIVQRHSGKLYVESELEKGTTFYMLLPLDEA